MMHIFKNTALINNSVFCFSFYQLLSWLKDVCTLCRCCTSTAGWLKKLLYFNWGCVHRCRAEPAVAVRALLSASKKRSDNHHETLEKTGRSSLLTKTSSFCTLINGCLLSAQASLRVPLPHEVTPRPLQTAAAELCR